MKEYQSKFQSIITQIQLSEKIMENVIKIASPQLTNEMNYFAYEFQNIRIFDIQTVYSEK